MILSYMEVGDFMSAAIRILSAGAPKQGIGSCVRYFTDKTGCMVDITFAPAPVLRERVEKGKAAADLLVAPVTLISDCQAAGHVLRGKDVVVGSVTAGIAVRDDVAPPDISSVEAVKAALLAADGVFYNTASSGIHIVKLLDHLGIADRIESKVERFPTGADVMVRLAEGKAACEIGFGQITEIRRFEGAGVLLVGPLPAEIGKTTTYAAGLLAGATEPAQALLAFMGSAEARQIYAEAGLE